MADGKEYMTDFTEPRADLTIEQAQRVLVEVFGYHEFRDSQAEIISALLRGHDVLTLMPTGGGKSLCYQIPSIVRDGVGVVVSPLIALMQDQVRALRQLGVRVGVLNSSLDQTELQKTRRALVRGELDLIYVAPERLLTSGFLELLERTRVALFAIDEAHCVSQWGHDFRKEYQQLSILHQRFADVPRIALTATADQRTRAEIIQQLDLAQAEIFVLSFDRPNIHYTVSEGSNARNRLWQFLQRNHAGDAGIVYCLSRKKVEQTAAWLCEKGRVALPYHAGLADEIRHAHQERFLREEGVIVVATIAFGMGIDKPDVRFVAHLSLPRSIEAYYQETGRAGRDGTPANAWLAYAMQDVVLQRSMLNDSDASMEYKHAAGHKLRAMLGLCEHTGCRRKLLLGYFGEHMEQACGKCDNCDQPPKTWDGTEASRKALSCVYRTGQRFGVSYLVDVLKGKADERIRRNRHDRLSLFGLGAELDANTWRAVFRQLIALGYLDVDAGGHGSIVLHESCRPLLRGEASIQFKQVAEKEKPARTAAAIEFPHDSAEHNLFTELRALRRELADTQGVPPYVIFHDATLKEMVRVKPADLNQLGEISGVGERKLARYGTAFIEVIRSELIPG